MVIDVDASGEACDGWDGMGVVVVGVVVAAATGSCSDMGGRRVCDGGGAVGVLIALDQM